MSKGMKGILVVVALLMCGTLLFAEGAKKQFLIAYSQAELVNAWRVTNQKDMEAWAQKLGVKLISLDANQDPAEAAVGHPEHARTEA